jgi:hypothetical protein
MLKTTQKSSTLTKSDQDLRVEPFQAFLKSIQEVAIKAVSSLIIKNVVKDPFFTPFLFTIQQPPH